MATVSSFIMKLSPTRQNASPRSQIPAKPAISQPTSPRPVPVGFVENMSTILPMMRGGTKKMHTVPMAGMRRVMMVQKG